MKNLLLISLVILLSSCGGLFYQVYETQPKGEVNDDLVFENGDLLITYDFWGKGGNSSFKLYNKTDRNVFIDLGLSHFIVNGMANTYFKNGSYGESDQSRDEIAFAEYAGNVNINDRNVNGRAFASGRRMVESKTSTRSYIEQRIICIPPKSAKIIKGFYINNTLFEDCDLKMYPRIGRDIAGDDIYNSGFARAKGKDAVMSFNDDNTPLILKNIISYGFDEDSNKENVQVENDFWIKKVINCCAARFCYN